MPKTLTCFQCICCVVASFYTLYIRKYCWLISKIMDNLRFFLLARHCKAFYEKLLHHHFSSCKVTLSREIFIGFLSKECFKFFNWYLQSHSLIAAIIFLIFPRLLKQATEEMHVYPKSSWSSQRLKIYNFLYSKLFRNLKIAHWMLDLKPQDAC